LAIFLPLTDRQAAGLNKILSWVFNLFSGIDFTTFFRGGVEEPDKGLESTVASQAFSYRKEIFGRG